ncbi:uncharacterized protein LOC100376154 [Saccoglossus kowalevskii]|uniref:Uncharacterized protein LOC100376154 n=1 Tax=Saccoglossus kowalevskii TaxID=10224 RepID=A0ABM0M0R2_SACKO|nr:PREDICTED: uncharacterized protein LOC100376154 [Saccoglossus kowalevskii]
MTDRLKVFVIAASDIRLYRFGKINMEPGKAKNVSLKPISYENVVQRHRNNDQVLQIMQFIRDQDTHQTRRYRRGGEVAQLRKPAPLPSIRTKHTVTPRYEVRTPDSDESGYNDMIDSDSDYELDMYSRTIPSPPRAHTPTDIFDYGVYGANSRGFARSHRSYHCESHNRNDHVRTRRGNTNRNIVGSVNHLPPIGRPAIPSRPSAPAPSFTPPLPDALDDYVPEDPIDYIDQQ